MEQRKDVGETIYFISITLQPPLHPFVLQQLHLKTPFYIFQVFPSILLFSWYVHNHYRSLRASLAPSFSPPSPHSSPCSPRCTMSPLPSPGPSSSAAAILQRGSTEPPKFSFPPLAWPEEQQLLAWGGCTEVTTEHLERQSWKMPPVSVSQFPCQ